MITKHLNPNQREHLAKVPRVLAWSTMVSDNQPVVIWPSMVTMAAHALVIIGVSSLDHGWPWSLQVAHV